MQDDGEPRDESTNDILYLVDRLEELVGVGKRVPFSGRVMVEEEQFLELVDHLRVAVPEEIKKAQRVIKEREHIIADAHDEATKILETAKTRAAYIVSEQGILNEARQQGEEILRVADERRKRAISEVDIYAMKQFNLVEAALREATEIIDGAVRDTVDALHQAKSAVGQ